MENFIQFFQSVDLIIIMGFVCLVAMGLLPGHNDVFLSLLVFNKENLNLSLGKIFFIFFISEALAEIILFFVFQKYGEKILKTKMVQKRFSIDKQKKMRARLNQNPFWVVLILRLTPLLRAYFLIIAASFNITTKSFFKYYFFILAGYLAFWISFYHFGGQLIQAYFSNTYITYAVMLLIWFGSIKIALKFSSKAR